VEMQTRSRYAMATSASVKPTTRLRAALGKFWGPAAFGAPLDSARTTRDSLAEPAG
jgi:hypothetical protein